MSEAQTLLAAILVLMLREIFGVFLSRSKNAALSIVGDKVDSLHSKVSQVETRVEQSVAPAAAKADEAMGVANQAVTMLNAMSSAFMPLIEGQKQMIASLLNATTANQQEREKLKIEIENRDAIIREKDLKIDTYMSMTDSLTADLGALQKQVAERDQASQRRDQQLSSLQEQVMTVSSEQDKARKELETTQSELAEYKRKLELAEQEIRDLKKQLQTERTASENEKARLNQQLKEAHDTVEKLRERIKELEDQMKALQAGQIKTDEPAPATPTKTDKPPDEPKPSGG